MCRKDVAGRCWCLTPYLQVCHKDPGEYTTACCPISHAVFDPYLQVCRKSPGEKGKYIKIILALLQSTSAAVVYECAVTLVSLSQVCIKAALLAGARLLLGFGVSSLPAASACQTSIQLCASLQ